MVIFEAFQQQYYMRRFQVVAEDQIQLFKIIKRQTHKWFIWFLFLPVLVYVIKRKLKADRWHLFDFIHLLVINLVLIIVSIFVISAVQFIFSGATFSFSKLFNEYFPFFTFQKGPIFIFGYLASSIIIYYYFSSNLLQVKVQDLLSLKSINNELYKKLSAANDKTSKVLNIKIGNKRKIISTRDIFWIEADDYCTRIHITSSIAYSTRNSLKSFEEELNDSFVRVHRGAIVNMTKVKELNLGTSKLILENDIEIPISRRKLKTVKEFYKTIKVI